jgi:hypothetical protein
MRKILFGWKMILGGEKAFKNPPRVANPWRV